MYTVYIIQIQVVRNLTGKTHCRFYTELVKTLGGAPAHISIDGAKAWNGVKEQVRCIFGEPSAATVLVIDNQVRDCRIKLIPADLPSY